MAQPKRQHRSYGVRVADEADAGPSVRGAPGLAVPHERVPLRELDGRTRVLRVLLRAGEMREPGRLSACPGAGWLAVDGPRDCQGQRARVLLDHVHAHGLERRVLRGGGLLGRHESYVVAFRATGGAHLIRAHRRCERLESTPQVPVWMVVGTSVYGALKV